MPNIELPDGRVAQFPDDMPLPEIEAIISKEFPSQPQEQPVEKVDANAFERGYVALKESPQAVIAGALETIGDATDNEGLQNYGREWKEESNKLLEQYRPESGFGQFAYDVAGGVGQLGLAIPAAAATALGAPAAAVLGTGATLATYGLSSGGEKYREAKELGVSEGKALASGIILGGAEAGLSLVPVGKFLKMIKGPTGKIGESIAEGFKAEAIEEGAVQAIEEAIDKGILDKDVTLEDALKRVGYSGLVGGVTGGTIGGGIETANVLLNRGDKPEQPTNVIEEYKPKENQSLQEALDGIINSSDDANKNPLVRTLSEFKSLDEKLEQAKTRSEDESLSEIDREAAKESLKSLTEKRDTALDKISENETLNSLLTAEGFEPVKLKSFKKVEESPQMDLFGGVEFKQQRADTVSRMDDEAKVDQEQFDRLQSVIDREDASEVLVKAAKAKQDKIKQRQEEARKDRELYEKTVTELSEFQKDTELFADEIEKRTKLKEKLEQKYELETTKQERLSKEARVKQSEADKKTQDQINLRIAKLLDQQQQAELKQEAKDIQDRFKEIQKEQAVTEREQLLKQRQEQKVRDDLQVLADKVQMKADEAASIEAKRLEDDINKSLEGRFDPSPLEAATDPAEMMIEDLKDQDIGIDVGEEVPSLGLADVTKMGETQVIPKTNKKGLTMGQNVLIGEDSDQIGQEFELKYDNAEGGYRVPDSKVKKVEARIQKLKAIKEGGGIEVKEGLPDEMDQPIGYENLQETAEGFATDQAMSEEAQQRLDEEIASIDAQRKAEAEISFGEVVSPFDLTVQEQVAFGFLKFDSMLDDAGKKSVSLTTEASQELLQEIKDSGIKQTGVTKDGRRRYSRKDAGKLAFLVSRDARRSIQPAKDNAVAQKTRDSLDVRGGKPLERKMDSDQLNAASLEQAMEAIAKNNPALKTLTDSLLNVLSGVNITLKKASLPFGTKGSIELEHDGNAFVYEIKMPKFGVTSEALAHEYVHAATAATIDMVQEGVLTDPKAVELVNELQRLFEIAKKQGAGTTKVGTNAYQDAGEFIAWAMTSRQFQSELSEMTTEGRTLFQRIVDAIARFFNMGAPKNRDMLEKVIAVSQKIVDMGQPNVDITQYNAVYNQQVKEEMSEFIGEDRADITSRGFREKVNEYALGVTTSVDKLRRNAQTRKLADALQNFVPAKDKYRGKFYQYTKEALAAYGSTSNRMATNEFISEYYAALQEGRLKWAEEYLRMNPEYGDLINGINSAFAKMAQEAQEKKLKVKSGKKTVDFKPRENYFPLFINRKLKKAIADHAAGEKSKDYDSFLNDLTNSIHTKSKGLTKEQAKSQAEKKLKELWDRTARGEGAEAVFGNIERQRQDMFPSSFYDFSIDAVMGYGLSWSERLAQVESFGQGETEFDRVKANVGGATKDFVDKVEAMVYNREQDGAFNGPLVNTLNTLATGLQLSNPASAATNLFGGYALTQLYFGTRATSRAFLDAYSLRGGNKELVELGYELGILKDDFTNVINDAINVSEAATKFTSAALKYSLFNYAEKNARLLAMTTARNVLLDAQKGVNVKRVTRMLKQNNMNPDILLNPKADGHKEAYENYLRRMVGVTQGTYDVDRVPYWINTAMGRFLFKYSKFSTQVMKMQRDKLVGNYEQAETPLEKAEVIIDGLKMVAVVAVTGGLADQMLETIFGRLGLDDPSLIEMLAKTFMDDEEKAERDISLVADLGDYMWGNVHVLGLAGLPGMVGGHIHAAYESFLKGENVTVSAPAPALAILNSAMTAMFTGVKEFEAGADAATIADTMRTSLSGVFGFYRGGQQIVGKVSQLGKKFNLVDQETVASFYNDKRWVQQYVRRYEDEMGYQRTVSASSKRGYANREIVDKLLDGRADLAVQDIKDALKEEKNLKNRRYLISGIQQSIVQRHPFAVYGDSKASSGPERELFKRWAKKNLSDYEYKKMMNIAERYESAVLELPYNYRPQFTTRGDEVIKYMIKEGIPR